MSRLSDQIREYVSDPFVSDHYGKWGAMPIRTRAKIRELCDLCDMFERTADDFAKRLYGLREWISVEERLPEDEQTVLTIDTEGEMQVCFYETAWKGVFHQCHGLVMIYNITHWMPLPEVPEMKGGAK